MIHGWECGFGPFSWIGVVWMVLFWGAIIALIVWAVKRFTSGSDSNRKNDALDIARERYARGDISKEEFDQIRKSLS